MDSTFRVIRYGWTCKMIIALMFALAVLCTSCALVGCSTSGGTVGSVETSTQQTFAIEGKWKNTGSGGFGQMQPGAITTFDGKNCNVYSPNDTYAFYTENGKYRLDVTGLLGGTPSFTVTVIDNDHISMTTGASDTVELTRVG